jgi:hypothetical protein
MKNWKRIKNETSWNKDIINILPNIRLWYSNDYWVKEKGLRGRAIGLAISVGKWNYYFTIGDMRELPKRSRGWK